ncbi:hypothetical protein TELCIR_17185 [Teladorsagia circumcincta]|uniref:Uncharacterized protein n=1 Tax=Teladorsagia circumcincta TaxID=45464 RepID=A0A2G9TTF4_TELCI|nr:hypothetical protein TELCIR_17185 [Teladorsagia circumcincta]
MPTWLRAILDQYEELGSCRKRKAKKSSVNGLAPKVKAPCRTGSKDSGSSSSSPSSRKLRGATLSLQKNTKRRGRGRKRRTA